MLEVKIKLIEASLFSALSKWKLFLSCSTQIWKQRWREHALDFNVPWVLCLEPTVPFMPPSYPMKDNLPCLPAGHNAWASQAACCPTSLLGSGPLHAIHDCGLISGCCQVWMFLRVYLASHTPSQSPNICHKCTAVFPGSVHFSKGIKAGCRAAYDYWAWLVAVSRKGLRL